MGPIFPATEKEKHLGQSCPVATSLLAQVTEMRTQALSETAEIWDPGWVSLGTQDSLELNQPG
jgi:hypothetical protein